MTVAAWDALFNSTAWQTLQEVALGPARAVEDMLDEIRANYAAERDRRAHFGLFSHEGVDIVCTDCNRGPTSEEDRRLFNLAEYNAWADQHKCEAKP